MESRTLGTVVRRLRRAVDPAGASTDADLVRAFAGRRDPRALEQIVRRHGPMVLGVCRRVLHDPADADDAFQATFLVFLRRAGHLGRPDRLAAWLYGVALRTARKVRSVRLARQSREGELFEIATPEPPAEIVWRELRPIFDQELDQLPEKLRLPAVLCFLEGQSKGEAARTLGWPEGTISGRLQQARERLRTRLAARGLTLSAGAMAVAMFEGVGSAAVPDGLLTSTLQLAATGPAGAMASAGVRALADGVTQAMFMTKVKALTAAVLVAGVVGTGTGVILVPGSGPGEVVAADPPKESPANQGVRYDWKDGRKQVEQARVVDATNELDIRNRVMRSESDHKKLIDALKRHVGSLRGEIERLTPLVANGVLHQTELDQLKTELRDAESQLAGQVSRPGKDPERELLEANLVQLKERVAWEERMVKKGFMTEAQAKKTLAEIARAEAALRKLDAPKTPDPRRAAADDLIRKLEAIVENMADGVRRGTVPKQDLLNAQATLARYKFELADTTARPKTDRPVVSAAGRAAMEDLIRKMEEIVEKTAEGVKKGIVPQQELLNAERSLLEYRFRLAELTEQPAADSRPAAREAEADRVKAQVEQKQRELARAEALLKQKAISQEEVRRLRIDLARLRAEEAAASGDHAAAAKQREAVVGELEAVATATRALVERRIAAESELRAAEVALAEARVDALQAQARQQLAAIVAVRELEVRDARALFDAKAISAEELRRAERALQEAKVRLAGGR